MTESGLARAVLAHYLGVRSGEAVTVEAWSQALPWARGFVVEARRLGATPVLVIEDEEAFFRSLQAGGPVPTAPAALARFGGAYVYLPGPEAFPRLFGLRIEDLALALRRHGPSWRTAARDSRLRAVSMTVATVTATAAARFGVNVDAWRTEVMAASVVPPGRLFAAAARLARPLGRARTVVVRHPNGTRLEARMVPGRSVEETGRPSARPERRPWTTVPTGRLLVPLAAGSVHGSWEANRPAFDRLGEPPVALGGRFTLDRGRLTEASFSRGGESLALAVARGRPRADAVTALSIGLNPRIAKAPEVGDLAAGAIGLRLVGPAVPGTGAGPPPLHVSVLQGADVDLDGRPWLVAGRPARSVASR